MNVVVFQWPCGTGARHRCPASLPAHRPAVPPGHLGRRPGFVDKYQTLGVQVRLRFEPGASPRGNVGPVLLAGVRCFFDGNAVVLAQQFDYFNERTIDLCANRGHGYRVMGFDPMGPARATPGLALTDPVARQSRIQRMAVA